MSQNCRPSYTSSGSTVRDANNNTLYHSADVTTSSTDYTGRGYSTANTHSQNNNYQRVTAKVLFGSVAAINDLKLQEKLAREARRTH